MRWSALVQRLAGVRMFELISLPAAPCLPRPAHSLSLVPTSQRPNVRNRFSGAESLPRGACLDVWTSGLWTRALPCSLGRLVAALSGSSAERAHAPSESFLCGPCLKRNALFADPFSRTTCAPGTGLHCAWYRYRAVGHSSALAFAFVLA